MGEELETFVRSGTKEERIQVSADEILNATAEGRDIYISYADIDGDLDKRKIFDRLEEDVEKQGIIEGSIRIIKGNIRIHNSNIMGNTAFDLSTFSGDADFNSSTFSGNAFFGSCAFGKRACFHSSTFNGDAKFSSSIFSGDAEFNSSTFSGNAFFRSSIFGEYANFTNIRMKYPGNFSGVKFRENTVYRGLWNLIIGKIERLKLPVTEFIGFNTEVVMDASSNPYLKRYIDDENWIRSWRQRDRLRKVLFFFWELTSHCGRSFLLWMFWALLMAVLFGAVYAEYSVPSWLPAPVKSLLVRIDPEVRISPEDRKPTRFTPYYFSIVTFTTLGFGDVKPMDLPGEIWLALEVVLGYIMLGGLISIFANKFARRS